MSSESIFISYANKDGKHAKELAQSLQNAGAQVWIESIHGTDDDDVTANAIRSAKVMLIVTSENALKDESLKQEKDYARENKVDRWLVKIESCETDSKMRWKSLPVIDLSNDKAAGMNELMERLGLSSESIPAPRPETQESLNEESATEIKPQRESALADSTESPKEPVMDENSATSEIARKESLLVTTEEIDMVRNIFKKQVQASKRSILIFISVSVSIILIAYFGFDSFGELFKDGSLNEFGESAEKTYDKLTKYIPAVGAILPNAFSGISASKINDKKKRLALVDKLERTRDRFKDNLAVTSESDIKALEQKLEELLTV